MTTVEPNIHKCSKEELIGWLPTVKENIVNFFINGEYNFDFNGTNIGPDVFLEVDDKKISFVNLVKNLIVNNYEEIEDALMSNFDNFINHVIATDIIAGDKFKDLFWFNIFKQLDTSKLFDDIRSNQDKFNSLIPKIVELKDETIRDNFITLFMADCLNREISIDGVYQLLNYINVKYFRYCLTETGESSLFTNDELMIFILTNIDNMAEIAYKAIEKRIALCVDNNTLEYRIDNLDEVTGYLSNIFDSYDDDIVILSCFDYKCFKLLKYYILYLSNNSDEYDHTSFANLLIDENIIDKISESTRDFDEYFIEYFNEYIDLINILDDSETFDDINGVLVELVDKILTEIPEVDDYYLYLLTSILFINNIDINTYILIENVDTYINPILSEENEDRDNLLNTKKYEILKYMIRFYEQENEEYKTELYNTIFDDDTYDNFLIHQLNIGNLVDLLSSISYEYSDRDIEFISQYYSELIMYNIISFFNDVGGDEDKVNTYCNQIEYTKSNIYFLICTYYVLLENTDYDFLNSVANTLVYHILNTVYDILIEYSFISLNESKDDITQQLSEIINKNSVTIIGNGNDAVNTIITIFNETNQQSGSMKGGEGPQTQDVLHTIFCYNGTITRQNTFNMIDATGRQIAEEKMCINIERINKFLLLLFSMITVGFSYTSTLNMSATSHSLYTTVRDQVGKENISFVNYDTIFKDIVFCYDSKQGSYNINAFVKYILSYLYCLYNDNIKYFKITTKNAFIPIERADEFSAQIIDLAEKKTNIGVKVNDAIYHVVNMLINCKFITSVVNIGREPPHDVGSNGNKNTALTFFIQHCDEYRAMHPSDDDDTMLNIEEFNKNVCNDLNERNTSFIYYNSSYGLHHLILTPNAAKILTMIRTGVMNKEDADTKTRLYYGAKQNNIGDLQNVEVKRDKDMYKYNPPESGQTKNYKNVLMLINEVTKLMNHELLLAGKVDLYINGDNKTNNIESYNVGAPITSNTANSAVANDFATSDVVNKFANICSSLFLPYVTYLSVFHTDNIDKDFNIGQNTINISHIPTINYISDNSDFKPCMIPYDDTKKITINEKGIHVDKLLYSANLNSTKDKTFVLSKNTFPNEYKDLVMNSFENYINTYSFNVINSIYVKQDFTNYISLMDTTIGLIDIASEDMFSSYSNYFTNLQVNGGYNYYVKLPDNTCFINVIKDNVSFTLYECNCKGFEEHYDYCYRLKNKILMEDITREYVKSDDCHVVYSTFEGKLDLGDEPYLGDESYLKGNYRLPQKKPDNFNQALFDFILDHDKKVIIGDDSEDFQNKLFKYFDTLLNASSVFGDKSSVFDDTLDDFDDTLDTQQREGGGVRQNNTTKQINKYFINSFLLGLSLIILVLTVIVIIVICVNNFHDNTYNNSIDNNVYSIVNTCI